MSTLDLDYYHDMVKLAMAYMATKAVVSTLSVEDFDNLSANLYPNPMKEVLNIRLSEAIETSATIVGINGKRLHHELISSINSTIDVSKLQSGIYFIKLKNRNGERTLKTIKE